MKSKLLFITSLSFLSVTQSSYTMFKQPKTTIALTSKSPKSKRLFMARKKKKDSNSGDYSSSLKLSDSRLPSLLEENTIMSSIVLTSHNINNTFSHGETFLIWAARNNQTPLITTLVGYGNLLINKQNIYGETALHYMAHHKNKTALKLLLSDPRTKASITNNENQTAREKIHGYSQEDTKLRNRVFAQIMLDLLADKIFNAIQYQYNVSRTIYDNDDDIEKDQTKIIDNAVNAIKELLIKEDEQQANDRELPDAAKIPAYATDEFIAQMLRLRLNGY